MGQPWSTTSRASLKRARGVSAALAWDTKTSWVVERFLGSSTPRPEVFALQAHSDRVVTRSRPTCPVSTSSDLLRLLEQKENSVEAIEQVGPTDQSKGVKRWADRPGRWSRSGNENSPIAVGIWAGRWSDPCRVPTTNEGCDPAMDHPERLL